MKESIRSKLHGLRERAGEVAARLSDPAVIADQQRFRDLSREYAGLGEVADGFARYEHCENDLQAAVELRDAAEGDERAYAEGEIATLEEELQAIEQDLLALLLPPDTQDRCNAFLEIRAGTGGNEAALFCGDLFRMYTRYCERQRWQLEVVSERPGEQGGFKELIARIDGRDAYKRLKFESGIHRVQRVPETEAQGRVHTSACTVAVLAEPDEVTVADIDKADLRVDTFRASGAGGQHVNKTDSAIRLTHLPTGIVVECQDERSQHKNRARAMALLRARLLDRAEAEQRREATETRRQLVGSGDRSEKIRTYNFPQARVTDHRIKLTLYNLPEVLDGALDGIIDPLAAEHQADLLAGLGGGE